MASNTFSLRLVGIHSNQSQHIDGLSEIDLPYIAHPDDLYSYFWRLVRRDVIKDFFEMQYSDHKFAKTLSEVKKRLSNFFRENEADLSNDELSMRQLFFSRIDDKTFFKIFLKDCIRTGDIIGVYSSAQDGLFGYPVIYLNKQQRYKIYRRDYSNDYNQFYENISFVISKIVPLNGLSMSDCQIELDNYKSGDFDTLGDAETSSWLDDNRAGIIAHLERFRQGGSFLIPRKPFEWFCSGGSVGREDGLFITTKSAMDKLLAEAGSNLAYVESALGVPLGSWAGDDLLRVDIYNPLMHNARLPSGMEVGANEYFIWGGFTNNGMEEAVIDSVKEMLVVDSVPQEAYSVSYTQFRVVKKALI